MKSNQYWFLLASLALSIVLPISPAHACACCAEPGDRLDHSQALDEYTRGVLSAVKFKGKARLYTTAADWDEQIKGITNPAQSDMYDLKVSRTAQTWTFDLRDAKGHKGRLTFQVPVKIHMFHVDTKPQAKPSANYVPTRLYKEWRLASSISGTGIFSLKKAGNSRAQLILHGVGNACTSSDQFTNWTLDVVGKGVQFRFFGRLRDAS